MTSPSSCPGDPIDALSIGILIEVDGTRIVAQLDHKLEELSRVYHGRIYPIGQFGSVLKIHFGRRILYAYVSRLRMKSDFDRERGLVADENADARVIEGDLFGEAEWIFENDKWALRFERGVSTFPLPTQRVFLTPHSELADVVGRGTDTSIRLGDVVGSGSTPFFLDMDELLGKHTAVLGSTGAGKSGTLAAILHGILDHGSTQQLSTWHPNIVIFDPHNEYHAAFGSHSRLSPDEGTLCVPYWLLDFEETIALVIGRTEHAATSQTNILKSALTKARLHGAQLLNLNPDEINVDSPIPYMLGNPCGLDRFGKRNGQKDETGLVGFINQDRPQNENQKDHEEFNKVIRKIAILATDTRLQFMMKPWNNESGDTLAQVVAQFLGDMCPVRIVDLSGIPNEVAGLAASSIARLIFNVKLWQANDERAASPVLLVCEEAHRYVPQRGEAQYAAARHAIQRIAKEGRKYGIGLMLVSQRPSEVDATVLSQCNSWIVLRITSDTDREHVRAVLPDSVAGLSRILSGLRQREAIVLGQAVSMPARVRVRQLAEDQLPASADISFLDGWKNAPPSTEQLSAMIKRWRYQQRLPNPGDANPPNDAPF